jgi:tripartite-type tricarboxylate transporter receptor subunit TctC
MILRALVLAGLASVLWTPESRAQAFGDTIAIVEPFGPGSPSELAIRVLKPALERELKARLLIEHIGSANGEAAMARVASGQPNGRMLLAITDATRIFHEYQTNTPRKLEQLKPVAKLTEGISMALAMPHGSPIDTWEKFVAQAKAKPMPVAGFGPRSPSALFQTMIERQVQARFASPRYDLDIEVLAAMARDHEPGIIPTSSALSQPALGRPAPVVLLTSGARRHPSLPNVPTLAEIGGNPRLAFTISVGLFGPPGMDSATAAALARAVEAAGKDEAVRAEARKLSLPLAVNDSAVLMETMKRTRRVIQELVHR